MNIWLINHYALPPTQPGGTRHYCLARDLIDKGHQVSVIASSVDYVTREESRLTNGETWKCEVIEGVPFLWLKTPAHKEGYFSRSRNMLTFAARAWAGRWEQHLGRPDVILGSSWHLFAALAAERIAARLAVPFVLEIRDIWPKTLIDLQGFSSWNPAVLALARIESYLYRKARRIIILLPGAAAHIERMGIEPDKIILLPNAIDASRLPPAAPPPENDVFTVMYAGAHGIPNGLDSMLDVAKLLQQEGHAGRIAFRFIGRGQEKARLCQRAREEGIRMASFEEPVPKQQVHALLQPADVLAGTLLARDTTKFTISLNKTYDYLAAARPVVFGASPLNNPIEEANAGITVPPEDAAAMAGAIKTLATMTAEERRQMGLRGRAYVEQHHNFAKLADRLEELFREVVDSHPAPVTSP